jgi:hypothetical protein
MDALFLLTRGINFKNKEKTSRNDRLDDKQQSGMHVEAAEKQELDFFNQENKFKEDDSVDSVETSSKNLRKKYEIKVYGKLSDNVEYEWMR